MLLPPGLQKQSKLPLALSYSHQAHALTTKRQTYMNECVLTNISLLTLNTKQIFKQKYFITGSKPFTLKTKPNKKLMHLGLIHHDCMKCYISDTNKCKHALHNFRCPNLFDHLTQLLNHAFVFLGTQAVCLPLS